ncbi:MAG: hypothetical protein OSJ70_00865 [Bacilli bacterium]|nr:hypothetical protein [Bacilli bacterium]
MLKKRIAKDTNKISREYLLEYLKRHKNIFSKYIYEYLECLINLDITILKNNFISEEEMQYLMQLGLVQTIAKYNIYESAYKIFQEGASTHEIVLSPRDEKREYLKVLGVDSQDVFIIFDYKALDDAININLYHLLESHPRRQKEIDHLVNCIDELYNNQTSDFYTPGEKTLQERIREYQDMRHNLLNREKISSPKFATLDYFNNQILSSYGFASSKIPQNVITEKTDDNMEERLVKKYPNITLTQNIKYY